MSRRLAAALFVVALFGGSGVAASPGPRSLGVGEAMFWEGMAAAESVAYELELEGGGHRLRAAVDHAGTTDSFSIALQDPRGRTVATGDDEAFVAEPVGGTWQVVVTRENEAAGRFRVRAKLEREPRPPRKPVPLLPNLRAEPAYDFTFSYVGAACGLFSNCGDVAPVPVPPFCAPDETAEDAAVRCLRFSFGYQNAGRGPMDLRFGTFDPVTRSVPVRQRIYLADATPERYTDNDHVEQDAATATYHEVHGHFHYDDVFGAQLLRVVDEERGVMEPVADVAKRGACAHDVAFVDFERFFQDPQGLADSGSDCSFTFTDPTSPAVRIGLSAGWGDIYPAGLSDNYVDFGLNGDGLYVLQVKADVDGTIAESNERDNFGYSLIEVSGLEVELLERGRGRSPWDPRKIVVRGLGD
ncbi:MAG TPA: hypothetical protein VHI71_09820 [Actinomycetota bacterium]|nr:hypothetical protein [Actinomycetota bacterium]